jgi:uncharacterized membrane protein YraQ (UPF0718 family)
MVDLGSLVLLGTIFGPRVALVYVGLGLVVAVIGGTIIEKLGMERYVEPIARGGVGTPGAALVIESLSWKDRLSFARGQTLDTWKKVFPYILVGVGIGAVIHNWIPQEWIVSLLGSENPLGVVLAVFAGVPLYADIFGTIPIAQALLEKGALLGTVLSFMMAVTTLSLPSLIMLRRAVKPTLLALFIGICTLGIIILGYVFNALQPLLL